MIDALDISIQFLVNSVLLMVVALSVMTGGRVLILRPIVYVVAAMFSLGGGAILTVTGLGISMPNLYWLQGISLIVLASALGVIAVLQRRRYLREAIGQLGINFTLFNLYVDYGTYKARIGILGCGWLASLLFFYGNQAAALAIGALAVIQLFEQIIFRLRVKRGSFGSRSEDVADLIAFIDLCRSHGDLPPNTQAGIIDPEEFLRNKSSQNSRPFGDYPVPGRA
jgi:hypothetical protein